MDVNQLFGPLTDFLGGLPHLIFALLVLLIGWFIAKGMGGSTRKLLLKTGVHQKISEWFSQEESSDARLSKGNKVCTWIGKVVYYLILLFVFLIFFNMLNLTIVAEPIVTMVSAITSAIPNVVQAGLILLLAWVLATILRFVVENGGKTVHLDRVFLKWNVAESEAEAHGLLSNLGKIVFYLIFVLFLPAVLNPLNIAGLTQPVSDMVSQFLNVLPNLIAAAIIVLIGWFIAKIVRDVLTSLLKSAGIEKLSDHLGLSNMLGKTTLSGVIGTIAYMLILIPTVITALEKIHLEGISEPAVRMLNAVFAMIPNIIVALVLVFVGVILGRWICGIIAVLLERLGFNSILHFLGLESLNPEETSAGPSQWVGRVAQVVIILLFAVEALQIVQLDALVRILLAVIAYLPSLFVSILIIGVGLYLGHLAYRILSKMKGMHALGIVSKYAIFSLALFMSLDQLKIADSIVNAAFILSLGALAVAFAVSFGIGGREFAKKQLEKWEQRLSTRSFDREE